MNPIWQPPAYLITVPQVVSGVSDDETSEDEVMEETFDDTDFKKPPFEIDWNCRGKITQQDEVTSDPKTPYTSRFIQKVEQESFEDDKDQAIKRVAVVIGYNRMRSLSNSVNRRLIEQTTKFAKSRILNREIHFYWVPQWINTKTGKKVEWKIVRTFYRQLKHRNPAKARLFRKESEGITQVTKDELGKYYNAYKNTKILAKEYFKEHKIPRFTRNHILSFEKKIKSKAVSDVEGYIKLLKKNFMIPYREIREKIIRHQKTKECAEKLQKNTNRPLYMAFQDGDVESMQGVFSNYDLALKEHFEKHKMLPEIASGGYKVKNPLNPILEIGVLIDLWIRHYTAKFFPRGVYFPEPNTLVRIKDGETTLEASFLDKANYDTPQEMPILISDLIKKRNIQNLSGAILFDARAALTTAVPERMQRSFHAFYTLQNKVVRWGLSDLKIYKSISQTHYKNLSWAKNIVNAIGIPDKLVWDKSLALSKRDLSELVNSLIARLFSTYDPFEVARREKSGFQKIMINLLNNYDLTEFPLAPKENRPNKGRLEVVWQKVDAINDMDLLLKYMDYFLQKSGVGCNILQAAKQSMKAVAQIFKENLSLNFTELSIAEMMGLDKPVDFIDEVKRQFNPRRIPAVTEIGSPLHQHVLEKMVESDWKGKPEFKKMVRELPENDRRGYLQTYPMHWAAITGNAEAVRFLKSCKGWISAIDKPGADGLLPLHCALRYFKENGEDLDLIRELATKEIVCRKETGKPKDFLNNILSWTRFIVYRESPLLQALQELYMYPKTLALLFQIAEVDPKVQEELLEMANEMKEEVEGDFEPKKFLSFAIEKNYSPKVIKLLIDWGAEFKACEDNLEEGSPFAVAIDNDYRDKTDRLALLEIIAKAGYDLYLKDDEDRTPLDYAIEKENIPVIDKLIELMAGVGEEPTEEQHEEIEQVRQRYKTKEKRLIPGLKHDRILDELERNLPQASNLTATQKTKMLKQIKNIRENSFY